MSIYILRPISDAGPNDGTPVPSSPGTHWDKVDDEPHDAGATILRFSLAGKEFFRWDYSQVPADRPIKSVTLRWTAIKGVGSYTGRAGFRVAGAEQWGPTRALPAAYDPPFEEVFALDPSTGLPWTLERISVTEPGFELVGFEAGLPRPDLNSLVGVVEVIDPPDRPRGKWSGGPPRAVTLDDLPKLKATVRSSGPRGSVRARAPRATVTGPGQQGEGA